MPVGTTPRQTTLPLAARETRAGRGRAGGSATPPSRPCVDHLARTWVAQSMASCCISSLTARAGGNKLCQCPTNASHTWQGSVDALSAFLMTALRSDMFAGGLRHVPEWQRHRCLTAEGQMTHQVCVLVMRQSLAYPNPCPFARAGSLYARLHPPSPQRLQLPPTRAPPSD